MSSESHQKFHEMLSKQHACYVLITCDSPNEQGNMNVQLSYDGDQTLASYLVQGAQNVLDNEEDPFEAPLRLIE